MNGPQNQPRRFYFTVQPRPQTTDHSPQPRIDFSCYEISVPDICSLICEPNMMKTVIFRSFAQLLRNFDLKICMYCIWHFQILEVTYPIHIFKLKLSKSCAKWCFWKWQILYIFSNWNCIEVVQNKTFHTFVFVFCNCYNIRKDVQLIIREMEHSS